MQLSGYVHKAGASSSQRPNRRGNLNDNECEIDETHKTDDQRGREADKLLLSFRHTQAMQAYAICHGVTARASTNSKNGKFGVPHGHQRLASYQFHPVSEKSGKVSVITSIMALCCEFNPLAILVKPICINA